MCSSWQGLTANILTTLRGLRPTTRSSMPGKGMRFFSSPERPGQFWNSLSLRFNVYWGSIRVIKRPGREAHHLHLVQRLMDGDVPPLPHTSSWCGQWTTFFLLTTPMKTEQCVPKRRHIKFRRRGITQKENYSFTLPRRFVLGKCKSKMYQPAAVVSGSPHQLLPTLFCI